MSINRKPGYWKGKVKIAKDFDTLLQLNPSVTQNILITGSSSGMGRAIAEESLKSNHVVIGLARDHSKFQPNNNNYHSYQVDFTEITDLEKQFKQIKKEHPSIDAIICCAGYGSFSEIEQFSIPQIQNLMNVNFVSQAILIKSFLPSMKKRSSGKIILLGSECALEGQKKGAFYCASKFALRGFSQSLRKECASAHISVTLINPGMVDTPFFDHLNFRPGDEPEHAIQADQIAKMVTMVIQMEHNCVCEEINVQPLKKVLAKK